MPVTSSTYTVDPHTQPSGARYVYERHTDSDGTLYEPHPWLAAPGVDIDAAMNARAARINVQLAETEAARLLDAD